MESDFTIHPSVARQFANAWSAGRPRPYPHLPIGYTLDTLLYWLQLNDPNGDYLNCPTDEEPWTMGEAMQVFCDDIRESWSEFMAEPAGYPPTVAGFLQWAAA
jgi:hypothetical protein